VAKKVALVKKWYKKGGIELKKVAFATKRWRLCNPT
jgi:hypothetical protein